MGLRSVETLVNFKKKEDFVKGQFPFCTLLTCSDSRIPIELVFDRSLGELFAIRSFGVVIDPLVLASAEYAALNFDSQVIVVMGHTRLGAVRAAMETEFSTLPEDSLALAQSTNRICDSLYKVRSAQKNYVPFTKDSRISENQTEQQRWEKVFRETSIEHIRSMALSIYEQSSIIKQKVDAGNLFIIPAHYEIETGQVIFEVPKELAKRIDYKKIESEAYRGGDMVLDILSKSIKTKVDQYE